ncbi:uncharacterized protein LOC129616288 [Condylostylus longicornis]|uniref:uncharacterized protein LOC129616288 n=1 Tax=Condylostylus longicornis TaxID=2530218 RepID=UPI00244DCC24|nr:uncharacterized protein LOC129616288 [Condylostylus longicornis]
MAIQPDSDDLDEAELTPHRVASHSNPYEKRGALILLGIMSEGCEDIMRGRIEELLPPVLSAFSDQSPIAKTAAAVCLGQMAEYLQPEITQTHPMTMKVLLSAMLDPSTRFRRKPVEIFSEHLEEFEIESYLSTLMPALLHVLTTTKANAARENCIGAIGSAAQAAKGKFAPYVEQVFLILIEAMKQKEETLIPLRARATGTAGCIIQELPEGVTAPYRQKCLELTLEGLNSLDHDDLREASYRFLGCLCHTLKDDFAPLIASVMPFVVATLKSTSGIVTQFEDNEDVLDGVDCEEDEEDERRIKGIHIRTGYIDEQEAAIDLLCCLYRNVSGAHMSQYLKSSLERVERLHRYFHSGIRQLVPNLMQAMLINVHHTFLPSWAPRVEADSPTNMSNPTAPESCLVLTTAENRGWIAGLPAQSLLHDHTIQLWIEKLWPIFEEMLTDDDDKEVVGDVCSVVGELLELLGPHLLQGSGLTGRDVHTSLIDVALKIFSGEHECQKLGDDGEVDEDEDSRAVEEYLFEGVSSLISGLAQTMGQQFQLSFSQLHPKILRLAAHKKSSGCRCIGIGCYGDIFKTMGVSATPFVEPVIQPALEGIRQSGDSSLLRNSAFCLGTICEIASALPAVRTRMLEILKALHPLIVASNENVRESKLCIRDNAIAALGRILRGSTSSDIPHDEVIPLFLQSLPLKADFQESEGVLKTILYLCFGGCEKSILERHQAELLKAIVGELVNGSLTKNTKDGAKNVLRSGIQSLGVEHPTIQAIANADPKYKQFLEKFMQQ